MDTKRCGHDHNHSPGYLGNRMLMYFPLSLRFGIKLFGVKVAKKVVSSDLGDPCSERSSPWDWICIGVFGQGRKWSASRPLSGFWDFRGQVPRSPFAFICFS